MNRRCIVLAVSNLEFGGAQRQVVEQANSMDPDRYDVHVCSLSSYVPLADSLRDRDRRLHIIQKKFKFDVTVPLRMAKLLRELRADIVHGFLFDAAIAARVAGRLARTPVVIGSERNTNYHIKRRRLLAYRLTKSWVDLIVANSSAGAEFNRKMLGHAPHQYRVVHNGVDTKRFCPADASAARKELGLTPDEKLVGMFASYKQQKNHPMFFNAAKRVLQRVPSAKFMLVGDELHTGLQGTDEYKQKIRTLVSELGIESRCLFLGNRRDVPDLYRACDITVLPSFYEGTPNVLLESMASGVPGVATDVSDNRYVMPDGKAGFIVNLGDEAGLAERLVRLLTDDAFRQQMGRQAREWVEQEFSSERLASKIAAVYDDALTGK